MTQRTEGTTIRFRATLSTIDNSTVLRLPETASKNLPSRGQVAVHGTINGAEFQTVLEPDGNSGGKRRPCCFNLSACTDPDLSKNGRLLEPEDDHP